VKYLTESIFGENLIFDKPPHNPKGWYVKKAKDYIQQFLKAIKDGTCTTGMAKVPLKNPSTSKNEKMRLYNAIKSLRRRNIAPVDVSIIEDDLWLLYEG